MFEHLNASADAAVIGDRRSHRTPQRAPADHAGRADHDKPRWASEQLLAGHAEVEIEHQGSIYRLRRTALGKLIMTK